MKNKILNYSIKTIKEKDSNCDEEKLAVIRYGLESIYILVTKTIFIFMVALILNIFKEVLIFTLFYNLIRMPSFGLHATKSWICLVSSTLIFIITPYICSIWNSSIDIRAIIGIITILLIFRNAPADTYKRPIVSMKRRNYCKFISTVIAIVMVIISLFIKNVFIHNALIMCLVVQCFMISPTVYKLFNLPYNNYKTYQNLS